MAHGKLVRELGDRYFFDRLRHSYFVYDGQVVLLSSWDEREMFTANTERGDVVRIPSTYFESYDAFKWPVLGYRKLNDNIVGRLSKTQAGGSGIKHGALAVEYSPMSDFLMSSGVVSRQSDWDMMRSAFLPQYDTLKTLPKLFAGECSSVVLNDQVMIEPTMRSEKDEYDIMHRGGIVGAVTPKMEIVATSNNNKNRDLVGRILNVS